MRTLLASLVTLAFAPTAFAADPLPQGDAGIAAGYPGDAGIGRDPLVVFADDFEGYADASGLPERWDAVFQTDQIRIATEPENVFGGAQAVEFTVPQQEAELSNALDKVVSPELDVLYLRFYSKFMGPYDLVGSSHNGAMISSHYFNDGQATPGVPADGTNKFLANLENWRGEAEVASPGVLNLYVYHPEQRSQWGDHFYSDGSISPYDPDPPPDYFGPEFVPRDNIIPTLDAWHCYEYMVQANTPGQRDGRIAFWYDGVLAGDFPNLRLRDVPELTIDRFGVSFHIFSNPDAVNRKWYDNIVAASSYIGPVYGGGSGDDSGSDGGSDGTGSADGGSSSASGDDAGPGTAASGAGSADDGASAGASGGDAGVGESSSAGGSSQNDGDAGCGCAATPSAPRALMLAGVMVLAIGRSRRRGAHSPPAR